MALAKQLAREFDFKIAFTKDGDWTSATDYVVHDIVLNSGTYYYCIQAHTASSSDEPGTGTDWEDYWNEIASEAYAEVSGVTSFSPSMEKNDADITDFDSEGWLEHVVASRSLSFDLEGQYIHDTAHGARDPGQYILEDLAENHGLDSLEDFRVVLPSADEIEFEVSIDAPFLGMSGGGGNDDPAEWTCTLTMTGQPSLV